MQFQFYWKHWGLHYGSAQDNDFRTTRYHALILGPCQWTWMTEH